MAGEPRDEEAEGLNANHRRAFAATFAHLDRSFGEIEAAMDDTASPLSSHVDDLEGERRALVRGRIDRLRERLTAAMRALDLRPPERIPITRALGVALTHAQIALDDLDPSRLRGYGLLGNHAAERVAAVLADLDRAIRGLATELARPEAADFASRIARIPLDAQRERLSRIERIVTRHGLVELRPAIAGLLELFEARTFEVALFGRVSSGKSSLINAAVLGAQVLPVGATPITAVPTRVRAALDITRAVVQFADGSSKTGGLSLLEEFVTEAGNPGNRRGVVRATAWLPFAFLLDGLVLVDTPGIGSLAVHGTRETYGYLPRCDLGVLLVEAASALGPDEIDLLRRLGESGIEAQVVLSKADLVPESDRARVRAYFEHEITRTLGRSMPVDLVSATEATLAKAWFSQRLTPLSTRAKELLAESATRKLAALQATTTAILRTFAEQARRPPPGTRDEIERLALSAEGLLRTTASHADLLVGAVAEGTGRVIRTAARRGHAAGAGVPTAITISLREEADGARQLLEADLQGTRARLRDLLLDLSRVARIGLEVPELPLDLITQPVLESPAAIATADLTMPRWPAVERRLAARIEASVGAAIHTALADYANRLRAWVEEVLGQLGTQVSAYTEACRALTRTAVASASDVDEDLQALERL
jgi:GTP-binding protein EngB required for normal cell division